MAPEHLRFAAEAYARRSTWAQPRATAAALLEIIAGAIGGVQKVSRDDGEWTPGAIDTCVPWFDKRAASASLLGTTGASGSLSMHRSLNVAKVWHDAPLEDPSELVEVTFELASAMPELTCAAVRSTIDRWPLYEANTLPYLDEQLGEMLDLAVVIPPAAAERLGRDRLLTAPAASVEQRDGWLILRVLDDATDPDGEQARARIVEVTRHLATVE